MSDEPIVVLIVGGGFAGLCLGIQLKRAGIQAFSILEKADDIGGTWRDNRYPGAACDVPSMQYCFSFEQKKDWSRKWAEQPEILAYIHHLATAHELDSHIRLNTEVASARFDEDRAEWVVTTTSGEQLRSRVLVSAVGQLNRPHVPAIPGLADFSGLWFHSARWRDEVDWSKKSVGVVGNAASAVQFIPRLAAQARRMFVFQRNANWILPKNDRTYSHTERARFGRFAPWSRLYRTGLWLFHESTFTALRGNPVASHFATKRARAHLEAQVVDPTMRAALTPNYPIGARRILISDDYYPALQRPNVTLVTGAIERIEPDAVITAGEERHAVEVIVFATGFESTEFLAPMQVTGIGGQRLDETWRSGAHAYLGMSVSGFPNLFLMYGPNTNLGHNSILFMLECQARYIVECLALMKSRSLRSIDVKLEAMRAFNERIQTKLARTVWAQADHSWYKTAGGKITNNWCGTTSEYWLATRRVDLSLYHGDPGLPR